MAAVSKADKSGGGAGGGSKASRAPRGTDINDLSDVLTASGIDLKEEENYLAGTYRTGPTDGQSGSGGTSSGLGGGGNSGFGNLVGSGRLSEAAATQLAVANELAELHRKAARAHAIRQQTHLTDPFLQPNALRYRLDKLTKRTGVSLSTDGVRAKPVATPLSGPGGQPQQVQTTVLMAQPADGSGIVSTKAACVVDGTAPLAELIALVSLATRERVRTVLEEAVAMSRGRRTSSDGVVPSEWTDLAVGLEGSKTVPVPKSTGAPVSVTGTSWESTSAEQTRKRSFSQAAQEGPSSEPPTIPAGGSDSPTAESTSAPAPAPSRSPEPTTVPTVAYSSVVASVLESLSSADRRLEEARLATRRKRQKAAAAASGSTEPVDGDEDPQSGTKLIDLPIKMSKREREKAAKGALLQSEEIQHKNANLTASLALGGAKKKYSWMDGGGAGGPGSSFLGGGGLGGSFGFGTPFGFGSGKSKSSNPTTGSTSAQSGSKKKSSVPKPRQFGAWHEQDQQKIEMRDLIAALHLDGNDRRAWIRASVIGLESKANPASQAGSVKSIPTVSAKPTTPVTSAASTSTPPASATVATAAEEEKKKKT